MFGLPSWFALLATVGLIHAGWEWTRKLTSPSMLSYWDKATPPPATAGPDPSKLKLAILGGTGRMGVHLGAHWANIGMDVMLCSRTPPSAQKIVDALKLGRGYRVYAKAGGEIDVPPPRNPASAASYKLSAGSVMDAASADIIVLATMYDNQWKQLEQIKDAIKGKGKIIIGTPKKQHLTDPPNQSTSRRPSRLAQT